MFVVVFLLFVCSGFRSHLSSLLCFITIFFHTSVGRRVVLVVTMSVNPSVCPLTFRASLYLLHLLKDFFKCAKMFAVPRPGAELIHKFCLMKVKVTNFKVKDQMTILCVRFITLKPFKISS